MLVTITSTHSPASDLTAANHGYSVRFLPVGPHDALVGSPTQMGVFERE